MYLCLDCDTIFEEPSHYIEKHGLDSPPYEEWEGCPCCAGTFVEALYCDGCNEPILNDYVELKNGKIYCECCFNIKNICD